MKKSNTEILEDLKARRGTGTAYDQLVRERAISNRLEAELKKKGEKE